MAWGMEGDGIGMRSFYDEVLSIKLKKAKRIGMNGWGDGGGGMR